MPHLITGLILSGLGLWGIINWWNLFGLVMRGVVPFFLLVFGLIAILASTRRVTSAPEPAASTRTRAPSLTMRATSSNVT